MHRYSEQIPWVWVVPAQWGYQVRCEVCGALGDVPAEGLDRFAHAHAAHRSAAGVGLGDAFAAIAKPIAGIFSRKPCTPCEARRRAMNGAVPRLWRR